MIRPSDDSKLDIWIGHNDFGLRGYDLYINGEWYDVFATMAAAERVAEELQREHDEAYAQENE